MNELDKEIEALESTLVRLKQIKAQQVGCAQPVEAVKKWEPVNGEYLIMSNGEVIETLQTSINFAMSTSFGTKRQTRQQAERAAVEMRKFNRLLALRDELCENVGFNWHSDQQEKHYLYFNHLDNKWYVSCCYNLENIQVYFTNNETAQRACDMLNSGEVEL